MKKKKLEKNLEKKTRGACRRWGHCGSPLGVLLWIASFKEQGSAQSKKMGKKARKKFGKKEKPEEPAEDEAITAAL